MNTKQQAFQTVSEYLNSVCFERQTEIRNILACLVSGQHAFMLGLPGIGKSYLIVQLLSCFKDGEMSYFDKLMTAHSDVSEVFGPISISAFKDDKLEYKTEGFLADVEVGFLDEIFKANSQVLNSLLTIMQERKFANGNQNIQAPLISLFGASNELPQDESLGALYDRFICRMHVQPLQSDASFMALMEGGNQDPAPQLLTKEMILEAQQEVRQVDISEVLQPLSELRSKLKAPQFGLQDRVYVSDRRWKGCLQFLKGIAWCQGVDKIDRDYLAYLADSLWSNPDDRADVVNVLAEFVSPVVKRTQSLYNESKALMARALETKDAGELGEIYVQLRERANELQAKLDSNPEKQQHLKPILQEFKTDFRAVTRRYSKMVVR